MYFPNYKVILSFDAVVIEDRPGCVHKLMCTCVCVCVCLLCLSEHTCAWMHSWCVCVYLCGACLCKHGCVCGGWGHVCTSCVCMDVCCMFKCTCVHVHTRIHMGMGVHVMHVCWPPILLVNIMILFE